MPARSTLVLNGELPLGITYPSKLGCGQCRAWWNRRADDDLPLVKNEPQPVDSTNVCISRSGRAVARMGPHAHRSWSITG